MECTIGISRVSLGVRKLLPLFICDSRSGQQPGGDDDFETEKTGHVEATYHGLQIEDGSKSDLGRCRLTKKTSSALPECERFASFPVESELYQSKGEPSRQPKCGPLSSRDGTPPSEGKPFTSPYEEPLSLEGEPTKPPEGEPSGPLRGKPIPSEDEPAKGDPFLTFQPAGVSLPFEDKPSRLPKGDPFPSENDSLGPENGTPRPPKGEPFPTIPPKGEPFQPQKGVPFPSTPTEDGETADDETSMPGREKPSPHPPKEGTKIPTKQETPSPTPPKRGTPPPIPPGGEKPFPIPPKGETPSPFPFDGETPSPFTPNADTPSPFPSNGETPSPIPPKGETPSPIPQNPEPLPPEVEVPENEPPKLVPWQDSSDTYCFPFKICSMKIWRSVIILGQFLNNAVILGSYQTTSLYLETMANNYQTSTAVTSLTPAISASLFFFIPLVLPPIIAKLSHRFVILLGSVIAATSTLMLVALPAYLSILILLTFLAYVGVTAVYSSGTIMAGALFAQSSQGTLGQFFVDGGSAAGLMVLSQVHGSFANRADGAGRNSSECAAGEALHSLKSSFLLTGVLFLSTLLLGTCMSNDESTINKLQERNFCDALTRKKTAKQGVTKVTSTPSEPVVIWRRREMGFDAEKMSGNTAALAFLSIDETINEITRLPRFDHQPLRDAKIICYLVHVLLHASGIVSIVMLLPTYLNASHSSTFSQSAYALMLVGTAELVSRTMGCILSVSPKKAFIFAVVNEFSLSFVLFAFIVGNKHLSQIFFPVLLGLSRGCWATYFPAIRRAISDGATLDRINGFVNAAGGILMIIVVPVSFQFVRWAYIPCIPGVIIGVSASALTLALLLRRPERLGCSYEQRPPQYKRGSNTLTI